MGLSECASWLQRARRESPLRDALDVFTRRGRIRSRPAVTRVVAVARRHSVAVGEMVSEESIVASATLEDIVTAGAWDRASERVVIADDCSIVAVTAEDRVVASLALEGVRPDCSPQDESGTGRRRSVDLGLGERRPESIPRTAGRTAALRIATPLDGTLIVRLRPAVSYQLSVVGGGEPLRATGRSSGLRETRVTYQICGHRSLAVRVAPNATRRFELEVTAP
jgi:hypothetical protein